MTEGLPDRLDNGLLAPAYVPLTDVAAPLAATLLTALGRARIAAYLANTTGDETRLRLYVAAAERADARTIVAAVMRANGTEVGADGPAEVSEPGDPLDGIDTDAEFAALIADWHVDTHNAIREAERELTREDEDWRARLQKPPVDDEPVWLDDEHYIPPPPPPLPRFAAPTIIAMALLAVSIFLLGFGGDFGLADQLTIVLGVLGVLAGAAILIMRLRERRDEDDDGAVL